MDTYSSGVKSMRIYNITILIADDESPARRELRRLLLASDEGLIIEEAENGLEVLEKIKIVPPEVLFLDIQMPGLDGIQTAEEVRKILPQCIIVFVTAFTDYAVEAFDVHAIDYLMKPVRPERLFQTLSRIREILTKPADLERYTAKLEKLISTLESPQPREMKQEIQRDRISVYQGDSIIPINIDDIIFAESRGRFGSITTKKGTFQTRLAFYELEAILTLPQFFMSHRSFIVQVGRIESIDLWVNNTYRLIMKDSDAIIPVSRGKVAEFKHIMNI